MDATEVSKEEFDGFLSKNDDLFTEKIRWSSPMRINYYTLVYGTYKLVGYSYDSYGSDFPAEYYLIK